MQSYQFVDFFFSSRRRHTRCSRDWSSDVCSSDLGGKGLGAVGGFLGHRLGGLAGAAIGGVNLKSKTADVVLTLTDVRSTVQLAQVQGHAKKTNVGWGVAAGGYFGAFAAAGASSYGNTEIGQVVAMAYLDSFTKLVEQLKQNPPVARADGDSAARADTAGTLTHPGAIQMGPSKLSHSLIIHKIKNSKRGVDTSSAALAALTKAGVSETVIIATMDPQRAAPGPTRRCCMVIVKLLAL